MRFSLYKTVKSTHGFIALVILVIIVTFMMSAIAVSILSTQTSKSAANDRALVQARYAADTGIERIKLFLKIDPQWTDGSVAVGKVDNTSEVEKVTIQHSIQDGEQLTTITSTGKCQNNRKTIRTVIKTGLVPLVSAYGGGIKQLGEASLIITGTPSIRSDVLVNGDLSLQGNSVIGAYGENRMVYINGNAYVQKDRSIRGNVYATGWANLLSATGQVIPYWKPTTEFPNIEDLNILIEFGQNMSHAIQNATSIQHYFPNNKTFTESELKNMEGIYFVEGDVYLQGGVTNARASIVSKGNIYITNFLSAESIVLMSAGNISLKNSTNASVALAIAGNSIGWDNTGGGNATFTLKYGNLVARTINGGSLRGNVSLEQNDQINLNVLAAPIHTTKIISYTEID